MEKKTPLYQTHVDMGGKIVEFGGFLMPVQYPTGVIAEHMAVREKAGLFDVSHMGELRLKGPDAVANVQKIITADISNMKDGEIKYSMFCNDNGGIIDRSRCKGQSPATFSKSSAMSSTSPPSTTPSPKTCP